MPFSKRGWLEVVADILEAANNIGGVNQTRIVYKANINFNRFKIYLEKLKKHDLLQEHSSGETFYKTTEKGRELLNLYRKIRKLI